jgi:acylphosphatase
MNIRVHVFVSGRVQGVFFRSNTKGKAEELCLTGWVRNLADGRVEAVLKARKEMLEKCCSGAGKDRSMQEWKVWK